jgi:hypothetical protein
MVMECSFFPFGKTSSKREATPTAGKGVMEDGSSDHFEIDSGGLDQQVGLTDLPVGQMGC